MTARSFPFVLAFALAGAAPLAAQAPASVPDTAAQADQEPEDGGLTGSVSADGAWQDLGIAITVFATDADVPTRTNAGSTAALGRALSTVVAADLKDNGLFKPAGPIGLPQPSFGEVRAPNYPVWAFRSAEMLVQGYVHANSDGSLTVGCYLYDVALKQQLAKAGWKVAPVEWRRAAHKCADMVYSRLSGESPFFDSRIAYIAETGPKGHRTKRLAVMDSDGANMRYLTSGQATALTPRYSPDYSQLLYLSYLNGEPSIYIYDLNTNTQKLLVRSKNSTFAPRWSPDGKWVLYSMAIAGNTDIYKIPSGGGQAVKLTDSPGIDIGGSFSPDGSRIVFESDRSGSQQVYVMNADGSNQHRISFFGGRSATPEWSPRGDQIAFTHIAGDLRIAVMTPDGRHMRYLTNSWQDEAPTWSPNGRIVQFFRTEKNTGNASIWQVDLTGRNERKLPTPVGASDPAWGPIRP
ncbi:Tol-Pal system beta propeller repeat protein TolB [Novosphingobium mangrovi (ex Huang et al. 2023)]|uniref:Tol-Pal system protein TolB n=1 Tax=Novosphingobium mangrovi (ex Huang et al. 2023) TaxID=2976432 RepID=A0ABT2I060_9SPHN|nr:Tol-Pal system beta propeller repeat protein TolB [Novosphingobium mangrovi (ex Huang et al. 2023)]MCT2398007.1 Tol-Pal system beta propeller repeat protein TolB [Novosphingobium mangrovi (ex Huang et al. 2023)]